MNKQLADGLSGYLQIIRKKWVLVLSVTLLVLIITAAFSFFIIPPTYESTASIIVSDRQGSGDNKMQYDTVIMYQKLMKTYSEIAKSESVFMKTHDKIGGSISLAELKKRVKVIPQTDTQILQVKAYSQFPKEAQLIASSLSDSFMEEAQSIFPVGEIHYMDKAGIPSSPVMPKKYIYMAVAFLVGLAFSIGMAFIIESADTTVKCEKDVSMYVGISVLACIPVER